MLVVESLEKNKVFESINYKYFYRLIRTFFNNEEFYGVEVERQDFINKKLNNVEREKINYLERNKEKAVELLNILCENEVSPIHLIEVLGEHSDKTIEKYGMESMILVQK